MTDPHPLRSCGSRRTTQPARYGPGADHCGGPPTDNASYSDIVFGIFRILGHNFSPRFKDLDDQGGCGPLGTAERQQAGEAVFGLEGVVVKQAAGLGVHRP
ncbi:Tn3 family transposase [Streptomyces sp. NPDC002012]|uniref:Tn3 family transposase n=1 Tax=Streptomyces sp. NPDC002012 TaxID=3154532 RepID=UPI003331E3D2